MLEVSIYDVLSNTFLYDEREAEDVYRRHSDADLRVELARYREAIDSAIPDLSRLTPRRGALRLVPKDGRIDIRLLTQCAWYVPEMVVADPLYALSVDAPVGSEGLERLLGVPRADPGAWRREIVDAVRTLRTLVPAVIAGYVVIAPWSRLKAPPSAVPLLHSDVGFSDALPEALMQWFVVRARVRPLTMHDGAATVTLTPPGAVAPTRRIAIAFAPTPEASVEDEGDDTFFYVLSEQQILDLDHATQRYKAFVYVPDQAPEPAAFDAWVAQSVHQSAAKFAKATLSEARLAAANGAHYLTNSPTAAALLDVASIGRPDSMRTAVLNAVLSFDVPFIEGATLHDVMAVRQQDGAAFEDFRVHLESELRELELEPDSATAHRRAEHVRHELAEVQLRAIERQMPRLRQRAAAQATIAVATLAASVVTGGASLFGTALMAAALVNTKAEHDTAVASNPAHFLWKVQRQSASSREH